MVIGYGNELRSDDAIGPKVANTIESWHLSSVQSLAVHQLTPELAANLATADLAIFVDACIDAEPFDVQVRSLLPSSRRILRAHTSDPQSLLGLTQLLYGHCPSAWLVTVPGVNFEIGDRLSPIAETGIAIALVKIIKILDKCKDLWVQLGI
jgi:hydrogenase maturation protease